MQRIVDKFKSQKMTLTLPCCRQNSDWKWGGSRITRPHNQEGLGKGVNYRPSHVDFS